MCRWLGLTMIEGGFDGPQIALSCFAPTARGEAANAPCYRCGNPSVTGTFSCRRSAETALRARVIPAIQAAAATLGGLQAEAAIRALHGSHDLAFAALDPGRPQRRAARLRAHDRSPLPWPAPAPGRRAAAAHDDRRGQPSDARRRDRESLRARLRDHAARPVRPRSALRPVRTARRCPCSGPGPGAAPHAVARAVARSRSRRPRTAGAPAIVTQLIARSAGTLLALGCRDVGIAPLEIVAACSEDGARAGAFKLSGAVEDLFATPGLSHGEHSSHPLNSVRPIDV